MPLVQYRKPWLSLDEQVTRLDSRGVDVGDHDHATSLLQAIGYYRLTGYLYPFRESQEYKDDDGRSCIRVLNTYRQGTNLHDVEAIIDFDRRLRMLVMEGVEHIEVAIRMQIGYVLGHNSPFAHEDPDTFTRQFTKSEANPNTGKLIPSRHQDWLNRAMKRRDRSDEDFVKHFHDKYDNRLPIWSLTEILELGQLSILYSGLNQPQALEISGAFRIPTKKIMASWLASLNYVRNVSAHHARLFNRKLQHAPRRPKPGLIPLLDHLRDSEDAKRVYGTYNALAVIAYLLPLIDAKSTWSQHLGELIHAFPTTSSITAASMGLPPDWETLQLWTPSARPPSGVARSSHWQGEID